MVVSARPRRPYRWRHNWIPRTPGAALVKAKGNQKLADRYMAARNGGGSTATKRPPRRDEGPYFRKTGPELRELAKKGDQDAQAELARRLARKEASGKVGGKRPGVPFRPNTDRPTPPPREVPKAPEPPKTASAAVAEARQKHGFASPEHMAALERENEEIASRSVYNITSRRIDGMGGKPVIAHSVRPMFGDARIGSIVDRDNGAYEAKVGSPARTVGTYPDREQAFRAVLRNHEADAAERKREADAKGARDARAAAANRKRTDAAAKATGGSWEPYEIPDDGTFSGRIARQKVKQAFRAGNTTVLIESRMNAADTQGLLADVRAVIDRSGLGDREITFRVPTGDNTFRSSNGGIVGAYVRLGIPIVVVNPGIANNKHAAAFEAAAHTGHFMPAGKGIPARQYTLTHELGHVLDGFQQDTWRPGGVTPSGYQLPRVNGESAGELHREFRGELSKYGTSSLQEGYAEAFAQWVFGGPGSSRVSDAFARRFGWPTPRSA